MPEQVRIHALRDSSGLGPHFESAGRRLRWSAVRNRLSWAGGGGIRTADLCRYTHLCQFMQVNDGRVDLARSPLRSSPFVLFALAYTVVRFLLEVLIVGRKPDAKLQAEVLALRHQLRVLERQVGRLRWH